MSVTTAGPAKPRDASIDILRGLVMVLMVLDHARDFSTSTPFDPTDPDKTTLALFFTRWITHFCAPVFMLLAGAGAGLSRARKTPVEMATFLVTRGLWLLVLEVTVVRFGWLFDLTYHFGAGQVIWALGWCMVLLAGLVFLPDALLALVAAALVLGHNAFDGVHADALGGAAWLWTILHQPGPLTLAPGRTFFIAYPLVPWIGVMALGYVLGRHWAALDRTRLVAIGGALTIAFFALRLLGVYGDPHPFVARTGLRTVFAFLDCQKYPPSLEYLCMTLGPALVLLGLLRGRTGTGPVARVLCVYGRAPMLFYLLHLPLVHLMTFPFRARAGLPLVAGAFHHGLQLSLGVVYALWIAAVVLLWWPTKRWAALKAARRDWWLSYL